MSPPESFPLITLSIVSHGDAENIQKLLESLRANALPSGTSGHRDGQSGQRPARDR